MQFDFSKCWCKKCLVAVITGTALLVGIPNEIFAENREDVQIDTIADNNAREENKELEERAEDNRRNASENIFRMSISETRQNNFVIIPERFDDLTDEEMHENAVRGPVNPYFGILPGNAEYGSYIPNRGDISGNAPRRPYEPGRGDISGDAPRRPYGSDRGDISGNAPRRPYGPGRGDISGDAPRRPYGSDQGDISGNAPRRPYGPGRGDISGNAPRRPYGPGRGDISGNAPRRPYGPGRGDISGNAPRRPYGPGRGDTSGNAPRRPYWINRENRVNYITIVPSQGQYSSNRKEKESGVASKIGNNVINTANGTVSLLPTNPKVGETVRIKAVPEKGYKIDKIIIVDSNGELIKVKQNDDGSYSFVQPASRVIIWVTFKKI